MARFMQKKVNKRTPYFTKHIVKKENEKSFEEPLKVEKKKEVTIPKVEEPKKEVDKKITEEKKEEVMTTKEKINAANDLLATPNVKRIKRDKGLIERTESSATILTEDNKELLKD